VEDIRDIRMVPANGLTLACQSFGDPRDVPVLLVMGLGTQMLGWPDEFCELLTRRGITSPGSTTGTSACPPTWTTCRPVSRWRHSWAGARHTGWPTWPGTPQS
jgi:hypothetical protein